MTNLNDYQKLLAENTERLKELACINKTNEIIKEGRTIDETLRRIVLIMPDAWQFPDFASASVTFEGKQFTSPGFSRTTWMQTQQFNTADRKTGVLEVAYSKGFEQAWEGPFLQEERNLLDNLATMISNFINSLLVKEMMAADPEESINLDNLEHDPAAFNRQLLQKFINKHYYDRDVYHDLMPFKVREILLVANLYDAYSIEKEGRFTEHILGEYHQLNLTSMPRITGVSNGDEALQILRRKHFDLVIIMMGVDKKAPSDLSRRIKKDFEYIPVYLLLNNNLDMAHIEKEDAQARVDKVFVWNGDSKIFFAMVKLLEDKVNLENDTRVGLVRIILLVEDSPKYYSRFLPALYNVVLDQTRQLIEDVNTDELYKVFKLRARPKIIHVATFEDATEIFDKFRDNMLCVISDVKFPKNGSLYENAGFELISYVKENIETLPTLLQSSDPENIKRAYELKSVFLNKNSETLLQDLKGFITFHLGFGSFIFRTKDGRQISVARTMKEFEVQLKQAPDDSILYHGQKNHFSVWLMARGEIQSARILNPYRISDFQNALEIRSFLLKMIQKFRSEKDRGRIVNFDELAIQDETNIVSLGSGALGGKGRGLAFVNTLIYHFNFSDLIPGINIRTPRTSIIGTDEFDFFIQRNKLLDVIHNETNYSVLRKKFQSGELSYNLTKRLKIFLKYITKPLAVRSSSLLEDSLSQPFAGVFETYLLPNNHTDPDTRLKQLCDAIKLVYASVYSPNARTYFEAINYKIEEEKMAIVLQEVVGNQFENYFYPHVSGTAQSQNYYPVGHMKPEEGFAVAALGLGQYVVEGEKTYRFSPRYPKTDINSTRDLVKNSQAHFYAVNLGSSDLDLLKGEDAGLVKLDLYEAEKHDSLKHCASVFDAGNDRLDPGINMPGPRVITFANILKYEYIPLAKTLDVLLAIVKEALGSPIEMEFAVDLKKTLKDQASFYLLQIKPLVGSETDYSINPAGIPPERVLLYTEKSMGNGSVDDIYDVVFVEQDMFDNTRTQEMVVEIERINAEMLKQKRKYILIGPGRWGTRDRFIGIPVAWSQISNARVIVEISMKDFPLDASLGSHFFHNVTSMNVGYFSVQYMGSDEYIRWNVLNEQEVVRKTTFFRQVRFKSPLKVVMDGKKRIAMILFGNDIDALLHENGKQ